MHNYSGPVTLPKTTDYDTPREVYLVGPLYGHDRGRHGQRNRTGYMYDDR